MRRLVCSIFLIASMVVGVAGNAAADESGTKAKTAPKPGPEAAAVLKMFGHGATWEGQVPAGALGPKSPATTSHGKAVCGPLVDGFWCRCDIEDRMGEGKDAKTWHGHMVVGYDVPSKSYRAIVVDNLGALQSYEGKMEGGTLTLTTPEPMPFMGMMLKDRLTFVDGTDGVIASFRDEHQVGDGPWMPFETVAQMKQIGSPNPKTAPMDKTR